MSFINFQTREINVKIVVYGPGLAGRTTNMQHIFDKTEPEARGKFFSLAAENERTLILDVAARTLDEMPGAFRARLHLYTIPGAALSDTSQTNIVKGVDGVIFVADSQRLRMEANVKSLESLSANLKANEKDISTIPFALQYNKRDLPTAMPIEEMNDALCIYPWKPFEAVAPKGIGVFESLHSVTEQILAIVKKG